MRFIGTAGSREIPFRSRALVTAEGFDKIAEIVKAAVKSDIGHRVSRGDKLIASMLNPADVQVFNGRMMGHLLEKATEVLRRHSRRSRKLLQR